MLEKLEKLATGGPPSWPGMDAQTAFPYNEKEKTTKEGACGW
jgi:hypothetical protein